MDIKTHNKYYGYRVLTQRAHKLFPKTAKRDRRLIPALVFGDIQVHEIDFSEHELKGIRAYDNPNKPSARLLHIQERLTRWLNVIRESDHPITNEFELFRQVPKLGQSMAFPAFDNKWIKMYPDFFSWTYYEPIYSIVTVKFNRDF